MAHPSRMPALRPTIITDITNEGMESTQNKKQTNGQHRLCSKIKKNDDTPPADDPSAGQRRRLITIQHRVRNCMLAHGPSEKKRPDRNAKSIPRVFSSFSLFRLVDSTRKKQNNVYCVTYSNHNCCRLALSVDRLIEAALLHRRVVKRNNKRHNDHRPSEESSMVHLTTKKQNTITRSNRVRNRKTSKPVKPNRRKDR